MYFDMTAIKAKVMGWIFKPKRFKKRPEQKLPPLSKPYRRGSPGSNSPRGAE